MLRGLPSIGLVAAVAVALACDVSPVVSPGEPVRVEAPEGLLAIGFASKYPIETAQLCSMLGCVDVGPFEGANDVQVVRLYAGRYCLRSFTLADTANLWRFEAKREPRTCVTVDAGQLRYFGHIKAARPRANVSSFVGDATYMGIVWRDDIEAVVRARYPSIVGADGAELALQQAPSPSGKSQAGKEAIMAKGVFTPDPDVRALVETRAVREHVPGRVVVAFCVDTQGNTGDLRVVESHGDPDVDTIIVDTIATWRFEPFMVDGRPTKTCTERTFNLEFRRR